MVTLYNALNISSNALTVNESAISVVSHNVANMNTEGYSKQKVNLATRNISGAIGNNTENQVRANGGVMIANIMRYNDSYLNNYYRDQLSILKGYEAQLGSLGDLADIFNDLDGKGISDSLANFYEAVNNLNEYPASSTARVNFIEAAKTLTASLNAKSAQLSELTTTALGDGETQESLEASKIYNQFIVFNDKLDELAEVNKALQVTQTGTLQANNLLDKRDMILNEISEFVDINIEENPFNGSVTLYVGGQEMVKGAEVKAKLDLQTAKSYCGQVGIDYENDWVLKNGDEILKDEFGEPIRREAAVISFVSPSGEVILGDGNSVLTGGTLGGLLHSTDVVGEDVMNAGKAQKALDNVAKGIAKLFNDLNTRKGAYCINPENTSQLKITFDENYIFGNMVEVKNDDGTTSMVLEDITAANISINSNILSENGCWNIACAYFENPNGAAVPPTYDINAIGNAQNVVAMLGTRNQKMAELGNTSIEDYYTNLLGKIAAGGSNAQALVDTQTSVVDSIYDKILSNNSVDLNEELVDLVKYQTAYSAAAQVFNTCNSCLDTLMALGG